MYDSEPTLDCQDCGRILLYLSPTEAQKVANDPYNYIRFCPPCAAVNERIERLHDY